MPKSIPKPTTITFCHSSSMFSHVFFSIIVKLCTKVENKRYVTAIVVIINANWVLNLKKTAENHKVYTLRPCG